MPETQYFRSARIQIDSRVNNAHMAIAGRRIVINEPCPFDFVYCCGASDAPCTPVTILNAAVAGCLQRGRDRRQIDRERTAERCGLWCHAQPEVQTTDEHGLCVINPLKPIVWHIIRIAAIHLDRADNESTSASESAISLKIPISGLNGLIIPHSPFPPSYPVVTAVSRNPWSFTETHFRNAVSAIILWIW